MIDPSEDQGKRKEIDKRKAPGGPFAFCEFGFMFLERLSTCLKRFDVEDREASVQAVS